MGAAKRGAYYCAAATGAGHLNQSGASPLAYVTDVDVPVGASQNMEDFLSARANLFNSYAQLHNQQLQISGTVNQSQVTATFAQQNVAALQTLSQRAQVVAAESDQQALPVPPPLLVPTGATPQVAAFLTLRDQLMRGFIQLHNQNMSSTPVVRQAHRSLKDEKGSKAP